MSSTENDEIKIYECEKHEDDNTDRLSPVIKEEEEEEEDKSVPTHDTLFSRKDRRNNDQEFYHCSPYYPTSNFSLDHHTGNTIYSLPTVCSQPWYSSISPHSTPKTVSRRINHHHHFRREFKPKQSHVKKPLNAFMLFMKEQRAQVVEECTLRESAAINQILGRKWHELDRNVQQKYYDLARHERIQHMQLYPGWSARDNYGVKKKRMEKGKRKGKKQECLNQKKCRARFGLEQQANWCQHCKRKKKCLRYTQNETISTGISSGSDTDESNDSDDTIPIVEEDRTRLFKY